MKRERFEYVACFTDFDRRQKAAACNQADPVVSVLCGFGRRDLEMACRAGKLNPQLCEAIDPSDPLRKAQARPGPGCQAPFLAFR